MAGKADVCQSCPGRALCLRQGVWALAGSSLQQLSSSDSLPSKPAAVFHLDRDIPIAIYHYLLKNRPTLKTKQTSFPPKYCNGPFFLRSTYPHLIR